MNATTPIRKARTAAKLTLLEVARAIGSDPGNLSRIERGAQMPSPALANRLCRFYSEQGVPLSLDDIYARQGDAA